MSAMIFAMRSGSRLIGEGHVAVGDAISTKTARR
jgi:hypothetical protein